MVINKDHFQDDDSTGLVMLTGYTGYYLLIGYGDIFIYNWRIHSSSGTKITYKQ